MKKLNKVAALFASATLAAPMLAFAQSNSADNWRASDGTVWKAGAGENCWRNASWTPATANPVCDGALKPPPPPPPAPAPMPAPPPPAAPPPPPPPPPPAAPPAPTSEKVTFAADAFFDFGKSTLKPEAKAKLDEMIQQIKADPKGAYFEIAGYTDSIGSKEFNEKLGLERAEAVKKYLYEQHQIPLFKMNVISYGEENPVAENNTKAGRAQNRRVVIRVLV